MVSFTCNLCGTFNRVEHFATEPATCPCGSNVRMRALIHLLSLELFGQSMLLTKFPRLKKIRGLGITDQPCYARLLAEKFDYTNTFYDGEPWFDFTEPHPNLAGSYDFILASDVLEHIAAPVETVLAEIHRLLKPTGLLGATVFCTRSDEMREYFPNLHEFRVVPLGDSSVLINRRQDGAVEIFDKPIFHSGGETALEVREFGLTALQAKLAAAGFRRTVFLTANLPQIGIIFDQDVSQPLVAGKDPYNPDREGYDELVRLWRKAEAAAERTRTLAIGQIEAANTSRWLRLGRRLGLGPVLRFPE